MKENYIGMPARKRKTILKWCRTKSIVTRWANEDVNSATRFKVAVSGEVKKFAHEFLKKQNGG